MVYKPIDSEVGKLIDSLSQANTRRFYIANRRCKDTALSAAECSVQNSFSTDPTINKIT
jgi:hypothetical protein